MTRPQMLPNLIGYAEWSLGTLRDLGLPLSQMMHIHLTLTGHTRGTALNLQAEMSARQDTGVSNDEWMETQRPVWQPLLSSGRFPAMEYISGQAFDYDVDAIFEYGLQRLLDGIEAILRTNVGTAPNGAPSQPRRADNRDLPHWRVVEDRHATVRDLVLDELQRPQGSLAASSGLPVPTTTGYNMNRYSSISPAS